MEITHTDVSSAALCHVCTAFEKLIAQIILLRTVLSSYYLFSYIIIIVIIMMIIF